MIPVLQLECSTLTSPQDLGRSRLEGKVHPELCKVIWQ